MLNLSMCNARGVCNDVRWRPFPTNLHPPDHFEFSVPCTVLVNCRWSREVRSKRFRTRLTAVTSGRVLLLLQFQFVQGLPGGGSVWRAARMIRDPRQTPPWHRWSKARWSAWRGVWMWDPSDTGMPLGLGAATAPLDGTDCAPIPLCEKRRGCPHPHAHTRTLRARSTHVHVSPTSRTSV